MIQRIIALTLERSIQRQWLYIGRMTAQGVPLDLIHFFRGADTKHYQNDYKRIADAAEADGYPFVRQFQGYADDTVYNSTQHKWHRFGVLQRYCNISLTQGKSHL